MRSLVSDQKIFAIVIGIERYQRDNLPSVNFASDDVDGFISLLKNNFNVNENNIKIYKNDEATKTSLENDIPVGGQIPSYSRKRCNFIDL